MSIFTVAVPFAADLQWKRTDLSGAGQDGGYDLMAARVHSRRRGQGRRAERPLTPTSAVRHWNRAEQNDGEGDAFTQFGDGS